MLQLICLVDWEMPHTLKNVPQEGSKARKFPVETCRSQASGSQTLGAPAKATIEIGSLEDALSSRILRCH